MGWLDKWWQMSTPNPSRNYGTQLFFPSLYGQNPERLQQSQANQFGIQNLLGQFGIDALFGGTSRQGYGNLAEILASKGKTDPLAMNRQLSDINASGQAGQTETQGSLARMGLGGSGLGQALAAAQTQGTAGMRQGAISDENQRAEMRKRQDLDLLLKLLINPATDYLALATNQYQNQAGAQQKDTGAAAGVLGSLLKAFGMGG